MGTPFELSPDGIELQACNATGHFALTMSLLPILKKTSSLPESHVRIVNLSSWGHNFPGRQPNFSSLENLNLQSGSSIARYGQSKLTVRFLSLFFLSFFIFFYFFLILVYFNILFYFINDHIEDHSLINLSFFFFFSSDDLIYQ